MRTHETTLTPLMSAQLYFFLYSHVSTTAKYVGYGNGRKEAWMEECREDGEVGKGIRVNKEGRKEKGRKGRREDYREEGRS